MSSADIERLNTKSYAIMGQLRKSNGLNRYLEKEIDDRDSWVISKLSDDDKWVYVAKFSITRAINGLSTIGDYTNKRGFTSKAHFNGGRYIGSCKKYGDAPIECLKYEVPSKDKGWSIVEGKFVKRE